jgi:MoaA/NifB/PqqE/SkfB family radical SAM enzyme
MAVKELVGDIRWKYRKLKENNAFGVLLHPSVIANYRRYEREQREKPIVMRSQPYGIEIEMTNRCNLACIQCFRSLGLKPYKLGDMDPENYQRILSQFPYVLNIALNGFGEPLMYAPFFDIVAVTRKMRPWAKIGIYTNGQLLDEAKAERAVSSGLTELNVSVDAARPATYRRVRRGGRLEPLHANIRRLLATRERARSRFPRVGLNFVMVNDNEGELPEFVEQAVDLGVDYINCISWAAYDWGFRNQRSADSYLRELEAAQARMQSLGITCRSMPEISTEWTKEEHPFACNFVWGYSFRVTFDGSVTLGCCTPFRETYTYGNLLEKDFWEIWNGPKIRKNREMAKQGIVPNRVCASCDMFCKSFFGSLHSAPEVVAAK